MTPKDLNLLIAQNAESFLAMTYGSNPAYLRGGVYFMGNVKGASGDSLAVWPESGTFKDFATGVGGDLIELYKQANDLDFKSAMKALTLWLGVEDEAPQSLDQKMEALQSRPAGQQWKPLPNDPNPWASGAIKSATLPSMVTTYHTKDGVPVFIVGRWEASASRKKFFTIASYREDGWATKAPDITLWPLWRENELLMTDLPVIVVEGEKTALWGRTNLPQYFWTTWHGGAQAVKRTDFISLANKNVILWPDKDEPGFQAMAFIASQLPSAKTIKPKESWPDKTDVADLTPDEVSPLIEELLSVPSESVEPERVITEDHREPNQLGSSYRFLDRYGADLRWLSEAKRWSFWDGRRWATDHGGFAWIRAVKTTEQTVADCLPWVTGDDKKQRLARVIGYSHSCKTTTHIKGILEGSGMMPEVSVSETVFDNEADTINCLNGILDLRNGHLTPHSRERNHSKLIEYSYDPSAKCPEFLNFLSTIMRGNAELVEFLQLYFGYSLTGLPPDRIFAIFYGSGRNGKSTLVQVISHIMGDYHVTVRSQSIMASGNQERPDKIGEDLIPLRGSRLATMQESDRSSRLNEGKVKELTGRDMMRCRYLHSNLWLEFVNTSKLILSTNHRPRVTGSDSGIWDRIAMVPFEHRIPDEAVDVDLADRIIGQEGEGVLAWMVEGAIRFYRNGKKIIRPQAVIQATDDYRSDEDMLGKFIEEITTQTPHGRLKVSSVYEKYRDWMTKNGDASGILGSRRFSEDIRPVMERNGAQYKRTSDGVYYFGLSFLDDETADLIRTAGGSLPSGWRGHEPEYPDTF